MTNPIAWFISKWLRWVFEADREPDEAFGDVPHVPKEAKRRAA